MIRPDHGVAAPKARRVKAPAMLREDTPDVLRGVWNFEPSQIDRLEKARIVAFRDTGIAAASVLGAKVTSGTLP